MRLLPLRQWICDRCREVIQSAEEGWLEWLEDDSRKAYGFRIVHHAPSSPRGPRYCYHYDDNPLGCGSHLSEFVGTEGMIRLLAFLDVGGHHDAEFTGPHVRDLREFVELTRRLTLPYFEEARLYWSKARSDGFFGDANEVWIYLPSTCKEIINRYGEQTTD